MICQHPIKSSTGRVCACWARYEILADGKLAWLLIYGVKVHFVCGRHANSVRATRHEVTLVEIKQ